MNHFLVELTYIVPFEQIGETLAEHRQFLDDGYSRGWLLMSGPQEPRTGGIVIARAASLKELKDYFARDPYHLKNIAAHRFVEFNPVKLQPFMKDWVEG